MSNNGIMTLDQATDLVQRINHRKTATPMSSIELLAEREDDSLVLQATIEGQRVRLAAEAESSILRTLGISRKFLDNASEDPEVVNSAIRESRMGATRKNNLLVEMSMSGHGDVDMFSLVQGRKVPTSLTLHDVWNVARDTGAFVGAAEIAHTGKGHYNLRLVTQQTANPRRNVGDVTMTGVNISLNGWVEANPFTFRLACANGMQRIEEGDVFSVEEGDLMGSLREILQKCVARSHAFNEDFVRSDEIIVPNPMEYVMRAVKIAGGSNDLRSNVADLLAEQAPDNSLYQILNIVTALGRQASDNPRKRDKVERVAGRILAMQAGSSRCSTCNSSVQA